MYQIKLIKIMKKIFVIISLFFVVKTNFAQNKKEQIIILQNSIDSIKTVFEKEIVVKKNLSSYIDSFTKLIVKEHLSSKKIEESNKILKNEIDIYNKKNDSLLLLVQKFNTQILDVQDQFTSFKNKTATKIDESEVSITNKNNDNSISNNDLESINTNSDFSGNKEIISSEINLNGEEILKLINNRQPIYTSLIKNNSFNFLYTIDNNELEPFNISNNNSNRKSVALYPIFYDSISLPIRFPKGKIAFPNDKFDLICTTKPLIGTGYSDINENLKVDWGQNIVFINTKNALLNKEIQVFPTEFNNDLINSHLLFYHIFNLQYPNVLSPSQYCNFFSEKYTFPDDIFEKRKIVERWSNYFTKELNRKRNYLNETIEKTVDLNLFVHTYDYDMKNKSFEFKIIESDNSYIRLSASPNFELLNTPNFSSDNNNYLNFISYFNWKIGESIYNGGYSFKIKINEDQAANISRLLNADRNIYIKIKTRAGNTYSNNNNKSFYKCNPCPIDNCTPYYLRDGCTINFQFENIEFSPNQDFSYSIKIW
jgi:hypothetical protein